jgi:chromosome segregation ATPase
MTSPSIPFQELISRVPAGEAMVKNLSALLSTNSAKFGYSEPVVKSLKMELHAVQERISSLNAGLKTWKDHLERIGKLEDARLCETEDAEAEVNEVAAAVTECEMEKKTHDELKAQLEKCQVGKKGRS